MFDEIRWDWPKQRFLRENGEVGNCWACCIAAILQVDQSEIPHFVEESLYPDQVTQKWLNDRGLLLAKIDHLFLYPSWDGKHSGTANEVKFPYIACGPSVRSQDSTQTHAVVMIDGEVVYDPHPSIAGLLCVNRTYMVIAAHKETAAQFHESKQLQDATCPTS